MNFLQLCQRARQEMAIPGAGPTSVDDQVGELKSVVDWVASAWDDIQEQRTVWFWQRGEFSFNTVASTGVYTPGDAGVSDLRWWDSRRAKIYLTASGVADESKIGFIPYGDWYDTYNVGAQVNNRPRALGVRPEDNALLVAPVPDAVYSISGVYWKAQTHLTAGTDTPAMPADFHLAIVWLAVKLYAAKEENAWLYAHADDQLSTWMARLERHQLPPITIGARAIGAVSEANEAGGPITSAFEID